MDLPKHVYIIGAGGVTSYFLPVFIKTVSHVLKWNPRIHIVDGDILEERNLTRQLFDGKMVEKNKAEALVEMYKPAYKNLVADTRYFHGGTRVVKNSLVFIFVDNHPARKAGLEAADKFDCAAVILAANEYTDSQGIYYNPAGMKGTALDPRVRYPEILESEEDDPTRPRGCATEAALKAAPQLAIANNACANYALQLFWFHFVEKKSLPDRAYHPIEFSNNFNQTTTRMEGYYASRESKAEAEVGTR